MYRLGEMHTEALAELLRGRRAVALLPVGSVEPHGPHLPLATDTIISNAASERAAAAIEERGDLCFLAPPLHYGVTEFASGFAGAISIRPETLTAFLRDIVTGLHETGFSHVCLVNNHLEPAHDAAVRAAIAGMERAKASVACPLTRRWARTLSAEFKSGACHAGRYETSIVLAAAPGLVDEEEARRLDDVDISLSDGIKAGRADFKAMGIERAYTGAPRAATAEEGSQLIGLLATMIATEVLESLAPA